MFILKNALISIIRNKGRNVLIGVIILVIACACTITLAINNTASDLINSYSNAYDKELTLSFDRKSLMSKGEFSKSSRSEAQEAFNNIKTYTVEDVKNFGESEHIESYYYTYSISLNGNNIDKATSETISELNINKPSGNKMPGGNMPNGGSSMDFTLTGYSSIESMSEFLDGTYTINKLAEDAWNIAFEGNYVFINQELATYNDLSLNDKIILEDELENTYEFKVIGIFEDNNTESDSMMSMFSNSANVILTNADVLVDIDSQNENINGSVTPTFIIDSYENSELILEEFYEKGLDENYTIQTNQDIAEAGVSSIKNVKSFSTTFLIITLVIGGVVLFILNMINIRERKYEIGVLRTIGISKIKVTMQFVFELLLVALLALMIGAAIGATLSKEVSNLLLSNEIENTENSTEQMKNNFGANNGKEMSGMLNKISGVPSITAYESIDAVVNIKVILQLLAIGVTLVLFSSLASMISIQRFSPLTILKERS